MFSKLKDKLKDALSLFSKKAEEEAEVKEVVVEKVVPVKEEKKVVKAVEEKKEYTKKESAQKVVEEKKEKTVLAKQKEHFEQVVKDKKKEEKRTEEKVEKVVVQKEVTKEVKPETIITKETPIISEETEVVGKAPKQEEKKGFFSKLFKKDEKKEVLAEDTLHEEDKELEEAEVAEEREEEKTKESKGLFGKIKETLTTKTISSEKFEELFWELELALLENNVSVEVIERIKDDLKQELVDKPLPRDVPSKIHDTLTRTLREILSCEAIDVLENINTKKNKPYVIAFFGINGTGKTTSIAKLTYYFQQQGLSVVLAACDTFRAAAIQQLGEHARKLNVKMIEHDYGSDAAAVAFDAVQYAEKNNIDVVLIDTAGRLHSNTNLMAELEKIIRVVKPDMKVFVGESITGNDCIEQARTFNQLVEMDGAILTKVDVDEKGGAPVSIAYTIKKPILFMGVGQEYKDLEKFDAETILGRLGL